MPPILKPQLTEPEISMLEIYERMLGGLLPIARTVLFNLNYYKEGDLQIPAQAAALTDDEKALLAPIAQVLMEAAVEGQRLSAGVSFATLRKLSKSPALFRDRQLPAVVEWDLARDYGRGDEPPGTTRLKSCGDEKTVSEYAFEAPTEANIKRAAAASSTTIS
jgi:hypothetical protein